MANEKRVRSGGVAGALSSGVAIAATSMSSAGLADLPVVDTTNHAALTLFTTDTNGRVTKREIVYVTAHTASATSATIVKAQESTTDQAWSTSDKWVHAPTVRDQANARYSFLSYATSPPTSNSSISISSTSWADLDVNTDMTVKAQAGDVLDVAVNAAWNNDTPSTFLTAVTRVSGANVNSIAGGGVASDTNGQGVGAWAISTSGAYAPLSGAVPYLVLAGDVSAGTVTLRFRARVNTAGTRHLFAWSGQPLVLMVRNLGPQES